jgi:hypothetical protein
MSDPKRLLDEGRDGDLSNLLSAGKTELPDDAQLGALAAKIGLLGGLGGAGAAGVAGASGSSGSSAGAASAAGAGAKVAGATAAKAGLVIKLGGAVVVAGAASATAIVATSSSSEAPKSPVGVGIVATAGSNVATIDPASTSLRLPDTDTPPEEPSAAPRAPAIKPAAAPSAEGPEVEVRLLERAQDALRARPAEALALADDHARRFPKGMLVQEREVIAIEALVKAGRTGDAKARAARFKQRFPGSSHARRIDTLVGE